MKQEKMIRLTEAYNVLKLEKKGFTRQQIQYACRKGFIPIQRTCGSPRGKFKVSLKDLKLYIDSL